MTVLLHRALTHQQLHMPALAGAERWVKAAGLTHVDIPRKAR